MASQISFNSVNNSSANNRNNIRPINKSKPTWAENAAKAYKDIINDVISHIENNRSFPSLGDLKNRVRQVEKDFPGTLQCLLFN